MRKLTLGVVAVATFAAACYSAGPYGYERHYVPLGFERELNQRGVEAVYNDVRNDPDDFRDTLLAWFGVVEAVEPGEGGASLVRLSFRNHQDRHLCSELERETCRVTVSEASSGTFTARVHLRPEDSSGRLRVAPESLLRVYCHVTGEYDSEGGPLLECEQYRHWPRGQWVDTGARGSMRR